MSAGPREFDFSRIRSLELDLGATPEAPVHVRHLRLCGERDRVGPPAEPSPGDTVTFLRNQDTACYTYELEKAESPGEVTALEERLRAETRGLERAVRLARLGGKQTLYAEAGLLAAEVALEGRAVYPWTRHPAQRAGDLAAALEIARGHRRSLELYSRGIVHEDDEDDSNIPLPTVPAFPSYERLKIEGDAFVDADGRPALLYAMNYHSDGPLCRFFAPADHRVESYAVGGGSRYDIEWSPVYRAFHRNADAKRAGFRGWCGHLVKDQWAMGGRKENVVVCLESEAVRRAVSQYNREHAHEWLRRPNLLYNILAYELMYVCYCEASVGMFRRWLEDKYGDIAALNRVWGTALAAFGRVVPPEAPDGVPPPGTSRGLWFDWTAWNTRRFTDILVWAKEDVRRLDDRAGRKVPLCAGGTSSMLSPNNGNTGIDEELIIAEVDDVILHEGGDLLSLDLLRSLADRPKPVVDPEHGGSAYGMLASFLHGKSAVSKFWWPKQPSRQFPHMTLRAPLQGTVPIEEVEEHLRVALDVRRLGREISLFWGQRPEVALHYSRSSVLQVPFGLLRAGTTPYLQCLRAAYDTVGRLDAPLGFVSERQLLAGGGDGYKVLVLPAVRHVPQEVFSRLDAYIRGGGNLVVLPESLTADEYARPQPYLARWGVEIAASDVPAVEGLGAAEQGYDQSFSRAVRFGAGRRLRSGRAAADFFPDGAEVEGIFQEIAAEGATVLAEAGGAPLAVSRRIGRGTLYYFAGTPTAPSLAAFMDELLRRAGVYRPLRLSAPDGSRLPQVEARLVHTKYYDLAYLINGADEALDFRLRVERPYSRVRELRSLEYWQRPEGVLPARQTLIFKLSADPVEIGRAAEDPAYEYRGM